MIKSKLQAKHLFVTLSLMAVSCFSTLSYAGVVLGGTRVIYSSDQNEVTVSMKNAGKSPVLVQSWVDNGDQTETPNKITSPFVLTPPINRIDAGKGQTLRISLIDDHSVQTDKESVFYLNVLEIPAKIKSAEDTNHMSIAFRTRVKLFYRPATLPGNPDDAADSLKWSITNGGVKATNNSPFYVTLGTVTYTNNGQKYVADGQMIAPNSSCDVHFKNVNSISDVSRISYSSLNDFGAVVTHKNNI